MQKRPSILIIESRQNARTFLEMTLCYEGMRVFSAVNLSSALLQLRVLQPDLIIIGSGRHELEASDAWRRSRRCPIPLCSRWDMAMVWQRGRGSRPPCLTRLALDNFAPRSRGCWVDMFGPHVLNQERLVSMGQLTQSLGSFARSLTRWNMKALKVTAGLILVLGLTVGLARQVAPAIAAQMAPNTIEGWVFLDKDLNGSEG